MSQSSFRRDRLTRPIYKWARRALPGMSQTEREALEAGEVWWDAALFSGKPNWTVLRETAAPQLSEQEKAFLEGPVDELCAMVDDWQITWETGDLPEEAWAFMKRHRFFGMIIPEAYGGLGFSAFAHSEVIRKLATRSLVATVSVMVPNSLGPGELLMQYGTEAQRDYWLPRLAKGEDIPCFGLTSPEAGSDAAAMTDTGVVCRGRWNGEDVLGIRLNWHKRYITLAPVATLLGLAFKLSDPDGLLGEKEDLGITVGLVPTDLPGVEIGRRHLPALQYFQNGPTKGHDVFIPLDHVLGGQAHVGQGWPMLMSALAAGRGISLPSQSAAAGALAARSTGNYARVREQFDIPIGKFEGIQERLARMAAINYTLDAARMLTCAGLDEGRKLAVISAIMKAHATERMRIAVTDAMDVQAGKAVIDGPSNLMGNIHRSVPVGITVEGANILTRYMIIFGQGAIRCHPYLLKEMMALEAGEDDLEAGLDAFDKAFWGHVGHSLKTFLRAWLHSWTGGLFAKAPRRAGPLRRHYRQLSRYSAAFALAADFALLTMGGALKRKELLSGRFGDILSELYLLSAVCRRWEADGAKKADLPLVRYAMADGIATIQHRFAGILANLPNRPAAWLLKAVIQPLGLRARGPSDKLVSQCAELLTTPNETRERLKGDMALAYGPLADTEEAFTLVTRAEAIERRVAQAGAADWREGRDRGLLTEDEIAIMQSLESAVAKVIAVDDFAPDELGPRGRASGAASAPPEGKAGGKAGQTAQPEQTAAGAAAGAGEDGTAGESAGAGKARVEEETRSQ